MKAQSTKVGECLDCQRALVEQAPNANFTPVEPPRAQPLAFPTADVFQSSRPELRRPYVVALEDRQPAQVVEDWAIQQSGHLCNLGSMGLCILGTCSCNGETYLVAVEGEGQEVRIPYEGAYCRGWVGKIVQGPRASRIGERVFVERAW